MDLVGYFQMLARYNRIANDRLYEKCAALDDADYRMQRKGSFGSIHGLLNHILLGDQIWLARLEGNGQTTPALATILFDDFGELAAARRAQDARLEFFFEQLPGSFCEKSISYTNSLGENYVDLAPVAVGHLFNHQTHHRGQIHVMLSQTSTAPPSLDLHRIINP